ncbi:hypothetical protein KI387_044341, partial [Taxus chinensis]
AFLDSWDKSTRRTRTGRFGRNRGLSFGTSRPKVRMGCEELKEPRVNGNVPRVFTIKRDKESRIG